MRRTFTSLLYGRRCVQSALLAAVTTTTTTTTTAASNITSPVSVALNTCMRLQGTRQGPPSGVPPELRAPVQGSRPQQPMENVGEGEEPAFEPPKKPEEPPKMLKIDTNDKGIVTIHLCRAPVNSLNLELLDEFNKWMYWLGSDESCRSVIITSAIPTVFSAGLDILELRNPQPERLARFWHAFQETWLILNTFPKPIVSAINGNSPAGGCIFALGSDARVMAAHPAGKPERPYRIGLNEVKLGIPAPAWAIRAYAAVLGPRRAERMVQLGETPTAAEAASIGLVDLVVAEEGDVLAAATREAERFLAVAQPSRWMMRDIMRRELLEDIYSDEAREHETQFVVGLMMDAEVQRSLEAYVARLKGMPAKK
ncbi:3,2-trans-enoyl-CoA isomerase [Trypanosoma theileri]|uniref:Enoyl-CoA delta isomerase 1, mitochondrial n=1 Tax=Trypanosoma theileri TaxID=67003 RepID=A0A1X0NRI1_9TRYP|nr:3,2-trans-enoyl-CoA isomerase [Trypanosoma theileri]ORC86789.1 3,2-trans-enoyl-CoA isomerase [Trypanosoma theileri]